MPPAGRIEEVAQRRKSRNICPHRLSHGHNFTFKTTKNVPVAKPQVKVASVNHFTHLGPAFRNSKVHMTTSASNRPVAACHSSLTTVIPESMASEAPSLEVCRPVAAVVNR